MVGWSKGAEVEKVGSGSILDTDQIGNKQAAVDDPSKFAATVPVPTAPSLPDWAVKRSARVVPINSENSCMYQPPE